MNLHSSFESFSGTILANGGKDSQEVQRWLSKCNHIATKENINIAGASDKSPGLDIARASKLIAHDVKLSDFGLAKLVGSGYSVNTYMGINKNECISAFIFVLGIQLTTTTYTYIIKL